MPVKQTQDEFIVKAKIIHNNYYDYSKVEYVNSQTKVKIICPIHGEFKQLPNKHISRKSGCKLCAIQKLSDLFIYDNEVFITKAKEVHGDKYDYSKVNYINSQTKVKIICPIHGEFEQHASSHLRGTGCRQCSIINQGNSLRFSKDEFITKAKEVHGEKYDYSLVEYVNSQTRIKIICREHGEFEQIPSNHIYQSNGCPRCSYLVSETQEEIYNWIKQINNNCILSDRNLLPKVELDITIPHLNLAIEYNGVWYHSFNNHYRSLKHLYIKYKKAQAQGLRIINIYEDEWINSRSQMEQIIKNALGVIPNKIAARKCSIWSCSTNSEYFSSHIKPFFNLYHHQGLKYTPLGIAYCLLYEDQIVACAYFGQNSYHANNSCELIRYATKADYKVQGGLSKLITNFRRNHPNFKQIVSYCDNRFFTGSSYLKAGFVKVKEINPGFSIILQDKQYNYIRKHRSFITKKRLSKYFNDYELDTLSQLELAIKLRWLIVPDCGQSKYVLT